MRKLFCLLSTVLLLFGCNDVDEFGLMLPDSVTLDEVRPISELTYEELDSLVDEVYLREEMRRNGGLLVQAQANVSGYDYLEVFCVNEESMLPSQTGDYWGSMPGFGIGEFENGKYYATWGYDALLDLPGMTIYCEAMASLRGGDQMPGFVDEIRDEAYYSSNSYVFSNMRSYTYPDAPVITEFYANGGDVIQASFYVPADRRDMDGWGICYSTSNPLPTVDDGVTYVPTEYDNGNYANVVAQVPGGTYNVRAFAIGTSGEVAYSPVQRVTCQGLMFSTKIDSVVYVNNMKYSDLPKYLPMATENQIQTLRGMGGYLIYASSRIEENGLYPEFGFTAFPNKNYVQDTEGYSDIPFCSKDDGSSFVYNLPLGTFIDYPTWYYRSVAGVFSETTSNMFWAYSEIDSISWENIPIIGVGTYSFSGYSFSISFRVHTFGKVAQSGVCYSTTNELPTLEHNDGILEYPNASEGTFDSYIEFNDILLPAGNYYFRIYSQTEDGIGYSSVMQTTIRSN